MFDFDLSLSFFLFEKLSSRRSIGLLAYSKTMRYASLILGYRGEISIADIHKSDIEKLRRVLLQFEKREGVRRIEFFKGINYG
jgi:hypothetical protein